MNADIRKQFDGIRSADRKQQGKAYAALLAAAAGPVDWAYEAWDELLAGLGSKDNRLRSIAAQLLSSLAASDPKGRMLRDFDKLLNVTRDEKFVTARHALQSLWKVGGAGKKQQKLVVAGLARRFAECAAEKNTTLIRYDIIECLRRLYDAVKDEAVRAKALELIETEPDLKYRKKYGALWPAEGKRR